MSTPYNALVANPIFPFHLLESPMENVLTDTPVPQLHDSHSENIRLDSSFLAFFRQSLLHNTNYCADPVCCSIFEIPNTSPLYRSPNTVTTAGLRYPLLLFEDLLHILPNSDLSQRAIDFDARVLPSLPFLSRISSLTAAATNERNGADLSLHMGLCKALLGSSADDNSHYGALWHATTSLILGAFEIDNSVGRRLTWLTSAVLIVASGGMQTDPLVRYRTAIVNGCVQAVRPCLVLILFLSISLKFCISFSSARTTYYVLIKLLAPKVKFRDKLRSRHSGVSISYARRFVQYIIIRL